MSLPSITDAAAEQDWPVLAMLRRYVPGRRALFGAAVVTTVLWRLSTLVAPYLLGQFVDGFLLGSGLSLPLVPSGWLPVDTGSQFRLLLGAFLFAGVVNVGTNALRRASWRWLRGSMLHDLRTDAFDAAGLLGVPVFESERTGEVMSVLNNDVNQLESFLDDGLQRAVRTGAFFVATLVAMLAIHWQLTLAVLAPAPVMALLVAGYQRAVEPRYDERREAVGALNTRIQQAVEGIETVKAFAAAEAESERVADESRAYWRADWAAGKLSALFFAARRGVSVATGFLVVAVGGSWLLFGPPGPFTRQLSAGTFVTFYFYSGMFVGESSRLADVADGYTDARASAKRVLGLLRYPTGNAKGGNALGDVSGAVAFEDVRFGYPEATDPALRSVSFAVEPGEFVGLIGPTGAGKSTVLRLLLRFYDPDSGTIAVDGADTTGVAASDLREQVGYVSQDPYLFDGSVAENIAYGVPDADRAAVVDAAKRANAHEFVTDLPEGYDTRIGERGTRLSGGQRQRLAIARAILPDPPILLLDEATSHVDNRTELLLQESLAEARAGRTTIAIAHRLSTVRDADRLLAFEDGEIVERGSHGELLDADGLYAELWRLHVGETVTPARAR
ncbi:ABC transporter ATP-binding protein [Halolamina salina]|uniref:ABC transporter ATP-binding protein n=1 Tax=Halolamina salina TaxID=1220023 RepID=A0ABD6B7H5_9EURY